MNWECLVLTYIFINTTNILLECNYGHHISMKSLSNWCHICKQISGRIMDEIQVINVLYKLNMILITEYRHSYKEYFQHKRDLDYLKIYVELVTGYRVI
jgi:hypothetical protein